MLKTDVDRFDRSLRVIFAIGLLGLVPLLTGLMSSCPRYSIPGWNSRSPAQASPQRLLWYCGNPASQDRPDNAAGQAAAKRS